MMNKFTKSLAITMSAVTLLTGMPCSADNVPTKAESAVKHHNKVSRLKEGIEIIGGICVVGAVGLGIYFAVPHVKEWIASRKADSSKTDGNKSGEKVAPSTPTKKPEDMTVEEFERSRDLSSKSQEFITGVGGNSASHKYWRALHTLLEDYCNKFDETSYDTIFIESRVELISGAYRIGDDGKCKIYKFLLRKRRGADGNVTSIDIKRSGSQNKWEELPLQISSESSDKDVVYTIEASDLKKLQDLQGELWELKGCSDVNSVHMFGYKIKHDK